MNDTPQSDESPPRQRPEEHRPDGLLEAVAGVARIYTSAWWRTAEWTASNSLRAAARLLGIDDRAARVPERRTGSGRAGERPHDDRQQAASLQDRGAELLRRSADVDLEEDFHPAYERILEELAPDEARILRLLAQRGPQPSVDVRAGLPLVSDLVAPGRSMIGAEAGCRHTERVYAYLNNLHRLGLIWFSREPVRDRQRYQVLEAQPEVTEPMERGGRTARTVRRSILLTPFGEDFCSTCLPLDSADGSDPQVSEPTSSRGAPAT